MLHYYGVEVENTIKIDSIIATGRYSQRAIERHLLSNGIFNDVPIDAGHKSGSSYCIMYGQIARWFRFAHKDALSVN